MDLRYFLKCDVVNSTFAKKWMEDFESFHEEINTTNPTYMGDFTRSLSLVLDTFYSNLNSVSVSSRTGEGMDEVSFWFLNELLISTLFLGFGDH